jgi:DNA-binding NtrC family response regulator
MLEEATRGRTLELEPEELLPAITLRFTVGAGQGGSQRAALEPGRALVLGSAAVADVQVRDLTVSARHCRVEHRGSFVEVSDLGSRNGVRVGGGRVDAVALGLGGAFDVGRTTVWIEPSTQPTDEGGEPLSMLVGSSRAMRRLAQAVRRIARLRLPVLLRGESGTGKDLVAAAIHGASPRSRALFVALNAATVSRELAESELFGHERGAFTGAVRERRGAFREAHRGTLFLDEIAALPLEVQPKLLRAVEEGAVRPLGAETHHRVDVRLVLATCEPLEALVARRMFRADLYERLAVCVVDVPPLRERLEDIAQLASHLLATSELGARELTPGALAVLRGHRWPGNVRELRNVVVQAALLADGAVLATHVAAALSNRQPRARPRLAPFEALRIYEEAGRNISAAARRAELPRTTMRDLLRTASGGSTSRRP